MNRKLWASILDDLKADLIQMFHKRVSLGNERLHTQCIQLRKMASTHLQNVHVNSGSLENELSQNLLQKHFISHLKLTCIVAANSITNREFNYTIVSFNCHRFQMRVPPKRRSQEKRPNYQKCPPIWNAYRRSRLTEGESLIEEKNVKCDGITDASG